MREVVDSASLVKEMASELMSYLVGQISMPYVQTGCSKCACYTALSCVYVNYGSLQDLHSNLSQLPYRGKFSYGANFRIFRMSVLYTKIKTTKI